MHCKRFSPRRWLLRSILICSLLSSPVTPQSETVVDETRTFYDSLDVEIVNVDVVVTDEDGEPVRGLSQADFEVFEDGVPVEVTYFDEVARGPDSEGESGDEFKSAEAESTSTASAPNESAGAPSLQLVVYINQLDLTPQGRNRILRELKGRIGDALRPGDLAMVIAFDGRARILQELTADSAELEAAVEQAMASAPPGAQGAATFRNILQSLAAVDLNEEALRAVGGDTDGLVFRARSLLGEIRAYAEQQVASTRRSVDGLRDVIGWLGSVPGRKALLYVGDGLPLQPAAPLFEAWRSRFEFTAAAGLDDLRNEAAVRTRSEVVDVVGSLADFAAAQRVAVYALGSDPRVGLLGSAAGGRGSAGPPMRGAALRWDPSGADASTPILAAETSGASFRGDPERLLGRLRSDFDTYYSLAYTPDRRRDARRHEVEVRLRSARSKHRKLELRYRRQYRAADLTVRLENLTRAALVLGEVDNPLDVAVDLGAPEEKTERTVTLPVMVRIPIKSVTLLPRGDHHEGSLVVFVAARDERGRMSDVMQTAVPIRIDNRQLLTALNQVGGYRMNLEVRGGRQTIAVLVYDQTARRTSAVRAEFSGETLPVDGPVR